MFSRGGSMFIPVEKTNEKEKNYALLLETLPFYLNDTDPWYTTLSNTSAMLNYFMDDINWIGFYKAEGEKLYLAPFAGLPACTEIMIGRGVCGVSAEKLETLIVEDVHAFEGHIACDSRSQSEIVVPIVKEGTLFGVLDIDAPIKGRFDAVDRKYLEDVVRVIVDKL